MEFKRQASIYRMTAAGICAALVFLTTAYLFHIPVGASGGYIHFGDSMIFLAASILPMPYAMAAAAIGAGLSDLMAPGGVIWILPTILIKPLMTLFFRHDSPRILTRRSAAAMVFGGLVNAAGYLVAGFFLTGGWGGPLAELPFSLAQFSGSAAFYLLCGYALDKAGFKRKIMGLGERQ